jgi:hypothetical protein
MNLLEYARNLTSQNGEDGIIAEIFGRLEISPGVCCEFGAWDGVHLSNCKSLIDQGWRALMIEGDHTRFQQLVENYQDNPRVVCVNEFVNTSNSSLDAICKTKSFPELDFLSIDIDGLDYEICTSLRMRPKLVCVEVNCGHHPLEKRLIDRETASKNVGQPFGAFTDWAEGAGYKLVCFTGNAFYLRGDLVSQCFLPALTAPEAYALHLARLDETARIWLWLVGLGIVTPCYYFNNPMLSRTNLRLGWWKSLKALIDLGSKQSSPRYLFRRMLKLAWLRIKSQKGSLLGV